MKVSDVLKIVREEKPSQNTDGTIIRWLNEVESKMQGALNIPEEERVVYSENEDADLLIPEPYADFYLSWIKAKIDFVNQDFESYANYQAQFNSDYTEAKAYAYRNGLFDAKSWPKNFSNIF